MISGLRILEKVSSVDSKLKCAEVRFKDDTHKETCDVVKGFYIEHYLDRYFIVKNFLDSY